MARSNNQRYKQAVEAVGTCGGGLADWTGNGENGVGKARLVILLSAVLL
jgi:hypothetical protein